MIEEYYPNPEVKKSWYERNNKYHSNSPITSSTPQSSYLPTKPNTSSYLGNGYKNRLRSVAEMTEREDKICFKRKISKEEFLRRHNIICDLVDKFPLAVDDMAFPDTIKEWHDYGAIKIKGIVKNYHEIPLEEEWPESDNPMIVLCHSAKKNLTFNCTTNWLRKFQLQNTTTGTNHAC